MAKKKVLKKKSVKAKKKNAPAPILKRKMTSTKLTEKPPVEKKQSTGTTEKKPFCSPLFGSLGLNKEHYYAKAASTSEFDRFQKENFDRFQKKFGTYDDDSYVLSEGKQGKVKRKPKRNHGIGININIDYEKNLIELDIALKDTSTSSDISPSKTNYKFSHPGTDFKSIMKIIESQIRTTMAAFGDIYI